MKSKCCNKQMIACRHDFKGCKVCPCTKLYHKHYVNGQHVTHFSHSPVQEASGNAEKL